MARPPKDVLKHLKRCVSRERRAARLVTTLTSWHNTDDEEKALTEAKKKTNQAIRYLAADVYGDPDA